MLSTRHTLDKMMPPRIPPAPCLVQLKHTVDIQLERAFHDEQWAVVANLARQRYKATKDDYYKAVEIAAKSHGDNNATDSTAGREIVLTMVNDNTTIKDVDALDLYEFAIAGTSMDYAKTIGVLRGRLVKALPKDHVACLRCLEACMWYSDWENAQEIAVSLNKNFPGDRRLLFHNILLTFLVASAGNTNDVKKKLFPNLVKAQVDRAFNLRPLTGKDLAPLDLAAIGENEVKLWLLIRQEFGSAQDNLRLLSLPNWGPLFFLERGLTDAFSRSIQLLSFNDQSGEIIKVVNIVFDKVISLGENPGTIPLLIQAHYINASREWLLWTSTVHAAKDLPNGQEALTTFRKKLKKVVHVLTTRGCMNPVFQKNYDFILLSTAFHQSLMATTSPHSKSEDNIVPHLVEVANKYLGTSNCFSTLKRFLEMLDKAKIDEFVGAMGSEHTEEVEGVDMFDKLLLLDLRLKFRFLQATSLTTNEECSFCQSVTNLGPDCETCLKSITECALEGFRAGVQDKDVSQKAARESEDPLSDLAILGSICLVKLAGIGGMRWQRPKESPLYHANIQLFLQAVVWLDFYLRKTPKNDALRLMLVRLYLVMGCVTQATQLFKRFDIKNTLLESLGILCYDRLASISPGHFVMGLSPPRTLAEPFRRYLEGAIQKRYPKTVIQALQTGNYEGIPHVIQLAQIQTRNCGLVLAVVEGRRGLRLKSGRNEYAIEEEPLIRSLSPDFELEDRTDYSPLPHWAGPRSVSIQQLTAYGPLPTNLRCHLSVLAERFLDLVCYVQPKDFKPSKAAQLLQVDWQAAASSCKTLHTNLDALFYSKEHSMNKLTGPEACYFRIVAQLAKLVNLVLQTVLPTASTKAARGDVTSIIERTLTIMGYQTKDFLTLPKGIHAKMHTLQGITALHAMGMLRESTLAIKYTLQYLGAALDRIKMTDKPRGTAEAAWLTPETKKLAAAAASADAGMKERVKKLADSLNTSGWVDRLSGWVFDDNDGVGKSFGGLVASKMGLFVPTDARETWAADVADSWRDVVKGWQGVRFD
ncbi:N-acetyltransferase B complex non catalytic subunit-domain-containing protein [Xylaria longipes]|nr:N-acetyltransferase B complex non catalytic subunit-domain-containing protein [Xylaria longipes]